MATTRASVQQSAKVQVPIAAGELIDRARARAGLDTLVTPGEKTRILTVCAPAGFGKTTAVSGWARALTDRRVQVAWCSLDATESHTFRFWSLLLSALTTARPELAEAGLAAPHRPGAAGFLNDLVESLTGDPIVVVVENLHEVVDAKVLADLDRFISLLPETVRLVLTSRWDPPLPALLELHLRGELGQLRVDDLAFTRGELQLLAPALPEVTRQLIWDRTDGWPALVQLMLLSLRTHAELPLRPFDDDYVMAEYLFRELLRRQEPQVQSLMLIGGLPDLLPLGLAVELSGMTDAGQVLERLAAASGLVTRTPAPLDEQPWYRFHPLLRAYLRAELSRTDRQGAHGLHGRAAAWFLDSGFALEAVRHARSSEDAAVLDQVVVAAGFGLVNAGEASLLLDALNGSSAWTPPTAPWTHVVTAAALADLGRVAEARGELATARSQAGEGGAPDLELALHAVDLRLRRRRGLPVPREKAIDVRRAATPDVQVYAAVQDAAALLGAGDPDRADELLRTAADLAEGLGRPAALLDATVLLGLGRAARSDFRGVSRHLDRAFALAREHGWGASPRLANAHVSRAWCARLRMEDGIAGWHVARASGLLDAAADPSVVASIRLLEDVMAFEADPQAFASADRVHRFSSGADGGLAPSLVVHAALVDARLSLMLHRVDRVHETAASVRRLVGECGELDLIDAMLHAASGHRRQALDSVRRVTSGQADIVTPISALVGACLETRLVVLEGDAYAATQSARRALELADRFDAPRAIVDFGGEEMLTFLQHEGGRWAVHERLARRITGAPVPVDRSPEVLTPRELEILLELPSLRTVDEIAGTMFVSVNTVKTHLRSVYRKLGVSSRRDAVNAGRLRGLL